MSRDFIWLLQPEKQKKNDIYRLFLIGQKQLPEIIEGKSTSEEKNWALKIEFQTISKTFRMMS
jgi:hypothetical protein